MKETEGEKDSSDGDDEDHGPSKQPSSVRSPSIRAEAGRTGSLRSPKGSDGTPTPGIGGTPLVGGSVSYSLTNSLFPPPHPQEESRLITW